jgi:hypothetical protein
MVHRQVRSSSFGRLAIPFLLLFLFVYADAPFIRCGSANCTKTSTLADQVLPRPAAPMVRIPLAFPYANGTMGDQAPAEPDNSSSEVSEPAAPALATHSTAPKKATVAQSRNEPIVMPTLPTDREVTPADINQFVERAARYYRTYGTYSPDPRLAAAANHPRAGGAGAANSVDLAPGGSAAPAGNPPGGITSQQVPVQPPATQAPPPPPPPNQGDPGSFATGSPGEPAGGFLG